MAAKVAYIARKKLTNDRTGHVHNFSNRKDLYRVELIGAEEPKMTLQDYSDNCEASHTHCKANLGRDMVVAIPYELAVYPEEMLACVWGLALYIAGKFNTVVVAAIHLAKGNPHAHIFIPSREFSYGLEGSKQIGFLKQKRLEDLGNPCKSGMHIRSLRQAWEMIVNRAFAARGIETRIDHRSYEARGLPALGEKHVGSGSDEYVKLAKGENELIRRRNRLVLEELIPAIKALKRERDNLSEQLKKLKKRQITALDASIGKEAEPTPPLGQCDTGAFDSAPSKQNQTWKTHVETKAPDAKASQPEESLKSANLSPPISPTLDAPEDDPEEEKRRKREKRTLDAERDKQAVQDAASKLVMASILPSAQEAKQEPLTNPCPARYKQDPRNPKNDIASTPSLPSTNLSSPDSEGNKQIKKKNDESALKAASRLLADSTVPYSPRVDIFEESSPKTEKKLSRRKQMPENRTHKVSERQNNERDLGR